MFFKPKFKVGDKVILTTTYTYETGIIRAKAGTIFIITERILTGNAHRQDGSGYTNKRYHCYSCGHLPWLPEHHLKRFVQPIYLTKSSIVKSSIFTRFINWLLH